MKIYTWNDETYTSIPNPLILADGSSISPVSEAAFIANGGTVEENGEPTHYEELCDACDTFIEVVLEIAEKIGDASFMGGINQQAMLRDSQYAKDNPTDALTLAERWNGADKACNFYADKPDMYEAFHSPNWYYFAWQRYADQLEAAKKK